MSDAENSFMQALEELQDNLTSEDNSKPLDSDKKIPTNPSNKSEDDGEGDMNNAPLSEKVYATKSKRAGDTDASKIGTEDNQEIAQNVQIVMKVLEGKDGVHNHDLFILAEKEIKRIEKSNEDISKFKPLIKLYDRADIINDIA